MFDRSDPDAAPPQPVMEFGARLRAERERRNVSLAEVAQRTKIGTAVFADLERDDFSRWPPGIFGRSFIRSYAEAVGLDPDDVVAEYLRDHPDGGPPPPLKMRPVSGNPDGVRGLGLPGESGVARVAHAGPIGSIRLLLADDDAGERILWRSSRPVQRCLAAAIDLSLLGGSWIAASILRIDPVFAVVLLGSAYFLGGTLVFGSSLSLWLLTRRTTLFQSASGPVGFPAARARSSAARSPLRMTVRRYEPQRPERRFALFSRSSRS